MRGSDRVIVRWEAHDRSIPRSESIFGWHRKRFPIPRAVSGGAGDLRFTTQRGVRVKCRIGEGNLPTLIPHTLQCCQPMKEHAPMNDYLARFTASPASFKRSFFMLLIAWVAHPIFLLSLFQNNTVVPGADQAILRMAIVSACLALLLFLIKKWARALVVVGNLFVVVNDLFYFAIIPHSGIATLLCVIVAVFATVGTYWLFVRESRDYFNQVNPEKNSTEDTPS
jgi:hypothetical protein